MPNFKTYNHFINVKIASFNCRGLNDNIKRNLLFDKFKQSDITLFCLQETKLDPKKEINYMTEWDKGPSFFNSVGGKSGTAILFNTKEIVIKKSFMDDLGRVISLDIDIGGTLLHLINTYFPNDDDEQYKFIYGLYPYFHSSHPILWAGDHNITTDTLDRRPRRNQNDRFARNILQILQCFDLKDVCRELFPQKNDIFTFTQGLSRSRIDKIIVNKSFCVKSYDHQVIYQSDHDMIISHIQLNQTIEKGFGIWKNNTSIYENDVFRDEFIELWNSWKNLDDTDSPTMFWMSCKKRIKSFLIDIGKILAQKKRNVKEREEEELRRLYNQALLSSSNQESQISIHLYLEHKHFLAKSELDELKERIEVKKYREFIDGKRPTKCFFQKFKKNGLKSNTIKNLYDQNGVLKDNLSDILNIAAGYHQNLYSENGMNENMADEFLENVEPIRAQFIIEELCRDFTVEEMHDAIYSFNNAKLPGIDGISIEFYKCVFSVIKDDLLAVFNEFKRNEFMPSKMKIGLIKLIPKGEADSRIENYRGITLNNVDLKILTKMLHNRLYPYLENYIHSSQYANKGKKIWEMNCILRDLYMEMNNQCDRDAFMVRIDF